MAVVFTGIVRTSSTFGSPITLDVSYTGADEPANIFFGSFSPSDIIGTGGAGSDTVSVTIPLPHGDPYYLNAISPPLGHYGVAVSDGGSSDSVTIDFLPMPIGSFPVSTRLTLTQFQFEIPGYRLAHDYAGPLSASGEAANHNDYWRLSSGQISLGTVEEYLGSKRFVMSAPRSSVEWDFGDGSTSTLENPTHTYDRPGSYSVTVTYFYTGLDPAQGIANTSATVYPGPGWLRFPTRALTTPVYVPFPVEENNSEVSFEKPYMWIRPNETAGFINRRSGNDVAIFGYTPAGVETTMTLVPDSAPEVYNVQKPGGIWTYAADLTHVWTINVSSEDSSVKLLYGTLGGAYTTVVDFYFNVERRTSVVIDMTVDNATNLLYILWQVYGEDFARPATVLIDEIDPDGNILQTFILPGPFSTNPFYEVLTGGMVVDAGTLFMFAHDIEYGFSTNIDRIWKIITSTGEGTDAYAFTAGTNREITGIDYGGARNLTEAADKSVRLLSIPTIIPLRAKGEAVIITDPV